MTRLKFTLLCTLLFSIGIQSFSKEIRISENQETKITISKNDYSNLQFNSVIADIDHFTIKTKAGDFIQLTIPGYSYSNDVGDPKIPMLKKIIEVPFGANFNINIINESYQEYDLADFGIINKIIPTQPPLSKSIDNPEDLEFMINESTYLTNEYLSSEVATVTYLGQMRNANLARLEIAPIQYNPVTNKIKVYYNLEVEVTFIGGNTNKTISTKKDLFSPYFEGNFSIVINYKEELSDELIMDEPVTYIIVSDLMFQTALQPFVEWKTKKGFNVVEAYTDNPSVGNTTTSIKSYLQDFYNNPPTGFNSQSFVLIVGDVAQIPTFESETSYTHATDLYYFTYDGTGDIYPECYYGRFSAENVGELQPQIDKTLEYEQYLMPDPSFLDEVVMVTGDDAGHELTWGNGQINYGTTYYFNLAHGITSHTYLQDEPPGGNYSENIRQNVSDGVAYGNYSAHCSSSGWADPSFVSSHISALSNDHKYPLLVGNCCLSNKFDDNDCFGENLLKAANKGTLGYIGGSNSTYWDEDYWWGVGYEAISANPSYNSANLGAYDRTFHDQGGGEPLAEWYVTQGQMPSAGNWAVTQAGSSMETYYWEIYHLMGDPSLMIYFSQPPVTTANYNSSMLTGTTTFTVNTDPYAYVAISKDGVLHGAAIADPTGLAEVSLTPIVVPGTADVVVTRQNGQPYIGTVPVITPSGPYVSMSDHQINDAAGNNNGMADFGENITFHVELENVGTDPAYYVNAILSTTNTNVTITDNTQAWGTINVGATSTQNDAFAIEIANNILDQTIVNFDLEITGSAKDTWPSNFSITVNAPFLEFGNMTINDGPGGNGRLDPGETDVIITVPVLNNGHSDSPSADAILSSVSPYITVTDDSELLGIVNAGGNADAVFNISCDPLTPIGTAVDLTVDVEAEEYDISNTFYQSVGLVLEDWEAGIISCPWEFAGNADWTITTNAPYEGTYCAQSGVITHSQISELVINVETTVDDNISFYRKVSSESGYDYLQFWIDGTQQEQWAGEVPWGQVSYFVPAGMHTFRWVYDKDGSVNNGSDCGWVDFIVFPSIIPPPCPDISLSVSEFEVTLPPGENTTEVLTISNLGEADLDFTAQISYLGGSKSTATVYPQNTPKWTGTTNGSSFTDDSEVRGIEPEDGWFMFDVSAIPVGSTINSIEFHGYVNLTNYPYWSMTPVSNNPLTTVAATLYSDINAEATSGYYLYQNEGNTYASGWKTHTLGGTANSDLEAAISQGWFAMGMVCRDNSTTYYINWDGWNETNQPYLVIDYTYDPINTWLSLDGNISAAGSVASGGNLDIDVGFDAAVLLEGDYYADINISSNDPNEPFIVIPCTLHVGGYNVSGYLNYMNAISTPMDACTVMLYNDVDLLVGAATTDGSGHYEFTGIADGNYSINLSTAKPWGGLSMNDVSMARQHFLNLITLSGLYYDAADVSVNGIVDMEDMQQMRQKFLDPAVNWNAPDYIYVVPAFVVSGGDVYQDVPVICSGDVDHSFEPPEGK